MSIIDFIDMKVAEGKQRTASLIEIAASQQIQIEALQKQVADLEKQVFEYQLAVARRTSRELAFESQRERSKARRMKAGVN